MAKLLQFSQGHPKPALSEKVQRGDKGKLFKNRPRSSPRLKGLKAVLHKWHYPPISMRLKSKDWRSFWGRQAAPKIPEWPSYGNLAKVTQNPHFLKKCKGGTKANFLKIAQKGSLAGKALQHSGGEILAEPYYCPRNKSFVFI